MMIEQPTPEEIKAAQEQVEAMMAKAQALTAEERFYICDLGYFNDSIKGYLIEAMQNAKFERADIQKALDGMRWALSENSAEDAAEIYREF